MEPTISGAPEFSTRPTRHLLSGQGTGWILLVGPTINAQYIARNRRWKNYLWYNQERFMNWTIKVIHGINEQLYVTSQM